MLRRPAAVCLAVIFLAWSAGFAWFADIAAQPAPPPPPHADGIVALTGGAERVETALRLLAQNQADLLLVTGVGGMAHFSELARLAGVDPALHDRVTLGRAATTTRGNALEAAAWARAHAIHSLLVVTSGYHMPRAMTEFARALPEVRLYPVPVRQGVSAGGSPSVPLRLLAGEYVKFLGAALGLSAFASAPQAASDKSSNVASRLWTNLWGTPFSIPYRLVKQARKPLDSTRFFALAYCLYPSRAAWG